MSAPRLSSACRAAALIAAMLAAVPAAAEDEITYLLPAPASLQGATQIGRLHLNGAYSTSSFSLSSDHNGGTLVHFV